MHKPLPFWVRAWFTADLLLALAPPLHWALGTPVRVGGVPSVLAYLFGSSLIIAASVVAAYLAEAANDGGQA